MPADGHALVAGEARGRALVLDEPLSFWGGYDPADGTVADARHPQHGAVAAGRVLVLPAVRGSSSSSSVLAEAVRAGTAPVAIVLGEPDGILVVGAVVARELYGVTVPVVVLSATDRAAIADGDELVVSPDGRIDRVTASPGQSSSRE